MTNSTVNTTVNAISTMFSIWFPPESSGWVGSYMARNTQFTTMAPMTARSNHLQRMSLHALRRTLDFSWKR